MATLPNMSIVTPTLGADRGTWDDKINAAFALVDAHDHTSGKGVAIVSAALNINADVAWGGYAITALGKVAFTPGAALSSGSTTLFVSSSDNELYWRTSGGANVQLTDGASINTSLVGGIGGDYSSVGADLDYDDANDRYTLKQETGTWARIAVGPVRIHEFNTSETVYVEHAVDAALAASYTVTWPAALPAAAALMQISAAGAVSFSNTTTQNITAVDFKYTSEQALILPAAACVDRVATHTKSTGGTSGAMNRYLIAASTNPLVWPLHLRAGDRITSFAVYAIKNTDNTNTISARLYTSDVNGTETALGSLITSAANGPGALVMTSGALSIDVTTEDAQYYLVFTPGGGVAPAADELLHAAIGITRPA